MYTEGFFFRNLYLEITSCRTKNYIPPLSTVLRGCQTREKCVNPTAIGRAMA